MGSATAHADPLCIVRTCLVPSPELGSATAHADPLGGATADADSVVVVCKTARVLSNLLLVEVSGQLEQAMLEKEDEVAAQSENSAGKLLELLAGSAKAPRLAI